MPDHTDPAPCPDCGSDPYYTPGLDEHGDACATCGGQGDLPAALAAQIACERAEEAAFDRAVAAPDHDTETTIRLVVRDPQLGEFHLKPLPMLHALEIVLAARTAGVPVQRLPDTGQSHPLDRLFQALAPRTDPTADCEGVGGSAGGFDPPPD
jgi:hypothetical protein